MMSVVRSVTLFMSKEHSDLRIESIGIKKTELGIEQNSNWLLDEHQSTKHFRLNDPRVLSAQYKWFDQQDRLISSNRDFCRLGSVRHKTGHNLIWDGRWIHRKLLLFLDLHMRYNLGFGHVILIAGIIWSIPSHWKSKRVGTSGW